MDTVIIQYIAVGLLFLGAVGFLARRLRRSFKTSSNGGCASGCGSCGIESSGR